MTIICLKLRHRWGLFRLGACYYFQCERCLVVKPGDVRGLFEASGVRKYGS